MSGIDTIFRSRRTSMLESFNFVDVATGQAIVTSYGFDTENGLNVLSNVACWSHTVSTEYYTLNPSRNVFDTDYDMKLERYLMLNGKVVVNVPMMLSSASENDVGFTLEVYLKKYSAAGVETLIDGPYSYTQTRTTAGTSTEMACFVLSGSRVVFGPGDTIRITLSGSTYCATGTDAGSLKYGHDPKNRTFVTGDTTSSTFMVLLPFKREL